MKNANLLNLVTSTIARICPTAMVRQNELGNFSVSCPNGSVYTITQHMDGWTIGEGASQSDPFGNPVDALRGLAIFLVHSFINELEDAAVAAECKDRPSRAIMCASCLNLTRPEDMETLTKCKACAAFDSIPHDEP